MQGLLNLSLGLQVTDGSWDGLLGFRSVKQTKLGAVFAETTSSSSSQGYNVAVALPWFQICSSSSWLLMDSE
jgi:hypothetical protein